MSYSKNIKKELCSLNGKIKNCCGYSFLYGILFCANIDEEIITKKELNHDVGALFLELCQQLSVKSSYNFSYDKNKITVSAKFLRYFNYQSIKNNVFKCSRCREYFFRGLFLSIGAITDPEKSYRLELIFNSEAQANEIQSALNLLGINPLITKRSNKTILYFRRSEAIEDFFANIGATSLAFDIMNSKINKELINNANRVTNCDSANINKALKASDKYISVINHLIETDNIHRLSVHLREMAMKRIEYKELSFLELGKQFAPPISKSGVYHRLEKILEFYEELKEKKIL
ncbi:MAG: DNA-binding protein WhiA [Clostridia bacterium]|nr:DNA-binding protein WhiA [Clostridia bacterium]